MVLFVISEVRIVVTVLRDAFRLQIICVVNFGPNGRCPARLSFGSGVVLTATARFAFTRYSEKRRKNCDLILFRDNGRAYHE
jgi:hypothetical protein